MHILVAHNVPRNRNGGMSRVMGFIHDRVVAAGNRVDYFCAEDVPQYLNGRIGRMSFPLLVQHRAVKAARARDKYHLINVHEPAAAAVATFKRATGRPIVVVTTHGVERRGWQLALEEGRLGRQGPKLTTRVTHPLGSLWQSEIALKRADHIFCLNFQDRDYLASEFGIPTERITRIYPGADPEFANAAGFRDYDRQPIGNVLFAATWRKNKGIEDLVPAFSQVAALHTNLRLVVLGSGVPPDVIAQAFPAAIRSRVEYRNAASEAETAAAFARADLFLLPSLFEGTPLTLIEAMMSGLPIVTTATCGMQDVIENGRNGLLVPIRSPEAIVAAIDRLIKDANLRARIGRAAQAEALQRFTWETVATRVRQTYHELLRHRNV